METRLSFRGTYTAIGYNEQPQVPIGLFTIPLYRSIYGVANQKHVRDKPKRKNPALPYLTLPNLTLK